MDRIRVCIAGATGWVGSALVPAVIKSEDLVLTGAVSRKASGRRVSEIFGIRGNETVASGSLQDALLNGADVMIDYTSPSAVKRNVLEAIQKEST